MYVRGTWSACRLSLQSAMGSDLGVLCTSMEYICGCTLYVDVLGCPDARGRRAIPVPGLPPGSLPNTCTIYMLRTYYLWGIIMYICSTCIYSVLLVHSTSTLRMWMPASALCQPAMDAHGHLSILYAPVWAARCDPQASSQTEGEPSSRH